MLSVTQYHFVAWTIVAWIRQRLDGMRDPVFSEFLVISLQYEGSIQDPLHYLSQSLRLYKDIEKGDTTRRNVSSTHNHNLSALNGYRVQGKTLEQQFWTGGCIQLRNPALHSHESGLKQLK